MPGGGVRSTLQLVEKRRVAPPIDLLGIGLYTPADVATLLRIPTTTIHRWIDGYSYPLAQRARRRKPALFIPALPRAHGRLTLTFLDLVQLRVVRAFREAGVSLQRIRLGAETASDLFGTSHPLAHLRLKTEGRSLWRDMVSVRGRETIDLSAGGQLSFPELVTDSLHEITYRADQGLAERWYAAGPGGGVVLDPEVAFGAPVVVDVNVPTRAIWEQARSEPSVDRLANWFRIDARQVQDALRYEESLQRAA